MKSKTMIEMCDVGNGITAVKVNDACIGIVTMSTKYPYRYALFIIRDCDFVYGDDLMMMVAGYCAIAKIE